MECRTCQWTVGFLGERESEEARDFCAGHPRTETQDDVGDAGFWIAKRANEDTAESTFSVTTSQRLKRWRETVPERPPVGESQVQPDHRTCSWTRGRSRQNIGSCVGASHGNQSPRPTQGYYVGCWNVLRLDEKGAASAATEKMRRCRGLHGRRDNTSGEKILHVLAKPNERGRKSMEWFVWMLYSSSEEVVVTKQGTAIKTRSANIPESERWDADRMLGIRAVSMVSRWQWTMRSTFKTVWRDPTVSA